MVIRASSGRQIDALLADLDSLSALTRDGAVARLTILGERAVARLVDRATDPDAGVDARVAALNALEGIADTRAFEPAINLLDDSNVHVAVAAVGVLQVFLASAQGVVALDRLTAVALDRTRPRGVRLAAIRAIRDVGPATIGPLLEALGSDPDQAVAMAAGLGPAGASDPVHVLKEAADGSLPETPGLLRVALTEAGGSVPVALLRQVVEHVRFREGAEHGAARTEWTALRGTIHAVLAHRGSRLALYDLKESLESARDPLPVDFLGAIGAIGDASCLESIAAAYQRAMDNGRKVDDWWRQKLTDVFRAIAAREGVTRRTAAGKRVTSRWKESAAILWP
ncbi:MAG: hypothetical protein QM736_21300 [Vicinamibacterales bacterium]